MHARKLIQVIVLLFSFSLMALFVFFRSGNLSFSESSLYYNPNGSSLNVLDTLPVVKMETARYALFINRKNLVEKYIGPEKIARLDTMTIDSLFVKYKAFDDQQSPEVELQMSSSKSGPIFKEPIPELMHSSKSMPIILSPEQLAKHKKEQARKKRKALRKSKRNKND